MADVKIGLMYSDLKDVINPAELGKMAEQWGYHSFWVPDHVLKHRMDPLTILMAVGQNTSTIRLGTAVMVLPYRLPYLTAKAAVSVDVLTNGRLMLGLGIGDLFHEFEALELDRKVRGRLSDERLEIIRRFFTEDSVTFKGEFHNFENVTLLPHAAQKPHVPIWLGGHWDQGFAPGVMKRTGRFADGFIPTNATIEGYKEAQKKIKEEAEAYGRDPSSIEWGATLLAYVGDNLEEARNKGAESIKQRMGVDEVLFEQGTTIGSPQACIDIIEGYAELGITQFLLNSVSQPPDMVGQYERISKEVLPHFNNGE
jgi:probable F420-dependent oxidoreductase